MPKPSSPFTTAYAAPMLKLIPLAGSTFALARYGFVWLPYLPFLIVAHHMVLDDPLVPFGPLKRAAMVLGVSVGWCGWATLLTYLPARLLLGWPLRGEHALASYIPLVTLIFGHDPVRPYWPPLGYLMHVMWDAPLVATGWVMKEAFGLRIFPSASVIDDDLVVGSMPMPSDIATLASPPFNVGAVVNMCVEYAGPTAEYAKLGLPQCRLPTQDTCMPRAADLREGAEFIAAQRAAHPEKRVLVHCKGGMGRAATMALAHYILNRGRDKDDALEMLKTKRSCVAKTIGTYPCIAELVDASQKKK